MLGVEFSVV